MESYASQRTKVARAAACAVALFFILLLLSPASVHYLSAAPLRQCPVVCQFDPTCGCWINCKSSCPPGGTTVPGGGTQQPGGTQPPPPQGTQPPVPTIVPPTGAPPGGYYATACGFVGSLCSTSYASTVYYVDPNGVFFLVTYSCVGACPTPQPHPQPTPVPTSYPCHMPPSPGGDNMTQPCASQWPGYDLSVSVKIPAVNAARNPWPRSLVGLATNICFISAPNSIEQFSANKAIPCSVDRGEHHSNTYDCGGTTGKQGEGARVNYQLGVAWRRYTGSDPGFGTQPPFISALALEERSWNGGNQLAPLQPGQCTQHTYETSSYGLKETFPPWNPQCQDRNCNYTERTLSVPYTCETCKACTCAGCVSAYSSIIQTWWWPEWTFKYDQYVCAKKEPGGCFYDPNPGGRGCTHGPNAGQPGYKETVSCTAWKWQNVTEPWTRYDVRQQGLPLPYIGSGKTNMAGMDPGGQVRTPFQYPPSIPVIEIQPVHP